MGTGVMCQEALGYVIPRRVLVADCSFKDLANSRPGKTMARAHSSRSEQKVRILNNYFLLYFCYFQQIKKTSLQIKDKNTTRKIDKSQNKHYLQERASFHAGKCRVLSDSAYYLIWTSGLHCIKPSNRCLGGENGNRILKRKKFSMSEFKEI